MMGNLIEIKMMWDGQNCCILGICQRFEIWQVDKKVYVVFKKFI